MNKYLFIIISFLILSCSNNSESESALDEKIPIKEIEDELLLLVDENISAMFEDSEENREIFKKYLSPEYKDYLAKDAQVANADSLLDLVFDMMVGMVQETKDKGGVFTSEVIGIKERLIAGDTLVYLVEYNTKLTIEKKKRQVTNTDYILTISNNYGADWYFYQPDVPPIKELIGYQLEEKATEQVMKFVGNHQPFEKIDTLK
jgi:hypothetical protein